MAEKLAIANPRRILLVGGAGSGKLVFLKSLTGTLPANSSAVASPAGLSHSLHLKTAYYTADVPIWIDELDPRQPTEWSTAFLAPAARGVLRALGGFVVTFRKPCSSAALDDVKRTLAALQRVVLACGYAWDGVCLAVAMPQSLQPHLDVPLEHWEDVCRAYQFEYVDYEFGGRNDYGEPAGMDRVREALEANDWDGGGGGFGGNGDDDDDDDDDDASFGSFEDGADPLQSIGDEMGREMFGLHNAIFGDGEEGEGEGEGEGEDEELQVEKLEAVMLRMAALKDMGTEVSKEERRKMAAKALSDIMKS